VVVFVRTLKLNLAITAIESNPSHSHGLWFSGRMLFTARLLAVVVTVMVTFPETPFTEAGLKLHDEADGNPLQLNVTSPAAGVAATPSTYCAGCPAFTVTVAPPEKMVRNEPVSRLVLTVLLAGAPPPETVVLIEEKPRGAFRATLNVTVTLG
jgi:hypothetical protein